MTESNETVTSAFVILQGELAPGASLGSYVIRRVIGRGGMGVVYEAEDTLIQRRVAIKRLPVASGNPNALKRFLREAQTAGSLDHPNILGIHQVGEAEGTYFIVMPLVVGENLEQLVQTHGALDSAEATRIVAEVCRGLGAAHEAGLVHRDIKPANIMRTRDGQIKIADFGLARKVESGSTSITGAGTVLGTPHYMSPEQCHSKSTDARSDLYALGATYFTLLTGRPPYLADEPMQVLFAHVSAPVPDPRDARPDLPESVSRVVATAMAKDPAARYQSALAFFEALVATGLTTGEPLVWGVSGASGGGMRPVPTGGRPAIGPVTPLPAPAPFVSGGRPPPVTGPTPPVRSGESSGAPPPAAAPQGTSPWVQLLIAVVALAFGFLLSMRGGRGGGVWNAPPAHTQPAPGAPGP